MRFFELLKKKDFCLIVVSICLDIFHKKFMVFDWLGVFLYLYIFQSVPVQANLLEAGGSLKEDMYYFSGEESSKAYQKARQFAQKVGTLGVDGQNKQWARASEDFAVASQILNEWKGLTNF